jgi:hypothetical protein
VEAIQRDTGGAVGAIGQISGTIHQIADFQGTIATAVEQRLQVTVTKNGQNTFRMEAPDLDLVKYSKTISDLGKKQLPKAVQFIELLYKRFLEQYPQSQGIDVMTSSEFSADEKTSRRFAVEPTRGCSSLANCSARASRVQRVHAHRSHKVNLAKN